MNTDKMNREDIQYKDRLLLLAERSNPHKPFNIKRKSVVTKQGSKSGPKLSMQDFVRMDPGYTPDIEHLVFPTRKRNPQQVAPINPPTPAKSRSRSRLVEMFALSRHLQQRSADRETKSRNTIVNRSVDSVLEPASTAGTRSTDTARRWVSTTEEPVRQNSTTTRVSPAAESDMAAARGPNVSVLHLRSTSEPWETSPTSAYTSSTGSSNRSYFANRSTGSSNPPLTKHQSLGGTGNQTYKWNNSPSFHSGGEVNSPDMFITGTSCNRELSPVRWCDREVDGVYLGRSGWVQVQQRSLDESRRANYTTNRITSTNSLQTSKRTGLKLSDYHCNSEPGNCPEVSRPNDSQRPAYLSLQSKDFERKTFTPSPQTIAPDSYSPPSLTPIISPPPAFQDRNKTSPKTRTFFGKTPFLPRSNAIEDSDASPPPSPTLSQWKSLAPNLPQPIQIKKTKQIPSPAREPIQRTVSRIPQTKSLEDTTATRRSKFIQRYGESSSSSSSSMGFRSLDSTVNRNIMPRLSENTDSSMYEDADEEDNNSSSINMSIISAVNITTLTDYNRVREKVSPSSRPNRSHHRGQTRRSPAGSDTNKQLSCTSPSSTSSTDSNEYLSRSPPGPAQQIRRSAPNRQYPLSKPPQEDISIQRVRRSRSLQLPEKKPQNYREPCVPTRISPQNPDPHKVVLKIGNSAERPKRHTVQHSKVQSPEGNLFDEDMLREAEVVTGYLYGSRSRAAAQALLMHRYNNNNISKEDKNKETLKPTNNGLTVYYVGNPKKERQKILIRGSTTPNLQTVNSKSTLNSQPEIKNPCTSDTCDFWPHCANRDSLNREAQFIMRSSQSYPTHQRSLDSTSADTNRSISTGLDRKVQEHYKRRLLADIQQEHRSLHTMHVSRKSNNTVMHSELTDRKQDIRERRVSPNKSAVKRDISIDNYDKKGKSANPNNGNRKTGIGSGSSSGSEKYVNASSGNIGDRKSSKNTKSSSASPLNETAAALPPHGKVNNGGGGGSGDDKPREMLLTRPGSAPAEERCVGLIESQQRSMSLPKSFLSASYQQG